MRPIKGTSGKDADREYRPHHAGRSFGHSQRIDLFTPLLVGDAVRSAAIGGEMTDHQRMRPRGLPLRKRYGLRYAVIAGIAAAGCCALQLPAVASSTAVHTTAKAAAATAPV